MLVYLYFTISGLVQDSEFIHTVLVQNVPVNSKISTILTVYNKTQNKLSLTFVYTLPNYTVMTSKDM
jgi:hypothetical protein